MTHRGHSQSVRFVTGHRVEQSRELDWPELASSDQTLVIYMGLVGIEKILGQLIAAGRSASTPAVLIENATLNNQRAVFASLDGLALAVAREQVTGPSIIIVGEVVALAPDYPGD